MTALDIQCQRTAEYFGGTMRNRHSPLKQLRSCAPVCAFSRKSLYKQMAHRNGGPSVVLFVCPRGEAFAR